MVFRRSFRRGNSLRPINRIKHVVDEQGVLVAGTQQNSLIISATDTPTLGDTDGVETGSKVNGFFLVVEVNATSSAALANVYLSIFKSVGGNLVIPSANTVGSNDNKRFVFHQEMVMLQQVTNSNPRTLFKGVLAIPRGYRRMGPNDQIYASLLSPGINCNYCIQVHYKEFR